MPVFGKTKTIQSVPPVLPQSHVQYTDYTGNMILVFATWCWRLTTCPMHGILLHHAVRICVMNSSLCERRIERVWTNETLKHSHWVTSLKLQSQYGESSCCLRQRTECFLLRHLSVTARKCIMVSSSVDCSHPISFVRI